MDDQQKTFEKWAALHVGDAAPNFAGKMVGHLWMYDDHLIEQFWMCWKAAQSHK